jgi:hypothetical protein
MPNVVEERTFLEWLVSKISGSSQAQDVSIEVQCVETELEGETERALVTLVSGEVFEVCVRNTDQSTRVVIDLTKFTHGDTVVLMEHLALYLLKEIESRKTREGTLGTMSREMTSDIQAAIISGIDEDRLVAIGEILGEYEVDLLI